MRQKKSDQKEDRTWEDYYKGLEGRKPRPLLTEALAQFWANPGSTSQLQAIDLGCGDGTETVMLLEAGWQVLAIDREPVAMAYVQSKVRAELQLHLKTRVASFEDLELSEADLVYAGYSLPFCQPEHFDQVWATITACIHPGGRFAGQLFGIRDSWANNPEMTFHAAKQVNRLLAHGFEIETLREVEEDGRAFSGPKHWHVFDIIARKLDL